MYSYNLMTLNAAAMLDNTIVRQRNDTHNDRPEFRYDFNEKSTKGMVLECTNHHDDNALFYQLIASQYGDENIEQYRGLRDCIFKSLVYVDFESVFSSQKKKENTRKKIGYSISNSKEWDREAIDTMCTILFEDGFSIVYEDGEIRSYIPFDKSGNMSRHYSITFVDKDYFPEVDRRLRLNVDFSSINVVLSKYFAYRGLYLTDGIRVIEDSTHFLNHKTVLVIDDDTHDFMQKGEIQNVPVITADQNLLMKGKFRSIEKEHPIRLNSFDGEGIVSPFYAEYMNQARNQEIYMKRTAVSFQVRMPYIKGMLHQVDFHRFFKEQLSEDDYFIKDIYGIPRRINDVHIVLTKSMFKCAGWLEDYRKIHSEIKDPMEWFFNMFHKYHHALYICNTDSNMGSRKVFLTYQFINTMDLDPDALDRLIKRHLNESHSITKTGAKYAVDIAEYAAETLFEDESIASSVPAWRYALSLNPDFVKDPFVRTKLKMEEVSRVKDVCSGRITVDGVLKYLSGDLLALLIHMIYNKKSENNDGIGNENGLGIMMEGVFQIDAHYNKTIVSRLRTQLIRTGKFYTSDHARLGLKTSGRYGILRSPHLSRNEQCSLRPYIPEESDEKNIYNCYFSHLKNVVMFPYESIDALSLGGADYDGDKVKIILDRAINSAILKGAYVLKGKDYERLLPVVEIPSLKADREPAPEIIPYRLVKNTFSNQVGLISDLAIKIGKVVYGSNNVDPLLQNKCAECTLATGLEIDAVKTGVRPKLGGLKKVAPSGDDYFLIREDIIKALELGEMERLKITTKKTHPGSNGGNLYSVSRPRYVEKKLQYKNLFDAELIPLGAKVPVIDRLPGYLLKDMSGEWKSDSILNVDGEKGRRSEVLLFKFQVNANTDELDTAWSSRLKAEPDGIGRLNNMTAIVKAYGKVANDASFIRRQKEKASYSNNMSKIRFLLMKIFDIYNENLPVTKTDILDAIEIVYSDIRSIFETAAEIEKAIERMKEKDWNFALPENREGLLYEILGTENLLGETKEILLCNEPDAFDFLKFYLYEIRCELYLQSSVDEIDLDDRKKVKYLIGYSVDDYKAFVHEYIVGQNNKEPKKIWNKRVIDLCRKKLASEDMFNGDFDSSLKYYYACRSADPNRHFLWEVFKTEEILRNVYIKPKE